MHTNEILSGLKIKILLVIALIIAGLIPVSIKCFSQNKAAEKKPALVTLGGAPGGSMSRQKVLENPIIIPKDPNCEVTDFTISFMPAGGSYFGPFKTTGSKIKENHLNYLKEFTTMNVMIYIEDIHVKCKGGDSMSANNMVIKMTP